MRMPRTASKAASLRTVREWLPRLAPGLSLQVPDPVHAGSPSPEYTLECAVYRWIDGSAPDARSVDDWTSFGAHLAGFVGELHGLDLMGTASWASRTTGRPSTSSSPSAGRDSRPS
ncbi:phosphotransferase [Agromyces sp. Marseille-P2726]|uniref:phosphotransferase n=1 Tax=Agromyces sp. Marseille-P2726 TaxID=2709132 RepID=UPI0035305476